MTCSNGSRAAARSQRAACCVIGSVPARTARSPSAASPRRTRRRSGELAALRAANGGAYWQMAAVIAPDGRTGGRVPASGSSSAGDFAGQLAATPLVLGLLWSAVVPQAAIAEATIAMTGATKAMALVQPARCRFTSFTADAPPRLCQPSGILRACCYDGETG